MKIRKFISVVVFAALTTFSCKAQQESNVTIISWDEVKPAMAEGNIVLVDVRTPKEFAAGSIEGAENIDYFDKDFEAKFAKFDKEAPIYIFCKSGNRSGKASKILAKMGFEEIYDIEGGYMNWEK